MIDTRIALHNDGKEGHMSWQATLFPHGFYGYGASKEEAMKELKSNIENHIKSLQGVNYENTYDADWCGKKV